MLERAKKLGFQLKKAKSFFKFMGLKSIGQITNFLLPFLVAKIVAPEIFGSFSLFKMIIFFGSTLLFGPILAPFSIEANKEYIKRGKSNQTFTSVLIYILILAALFLLVFSFFGREIIEFTGLPYNAYKSVFIMAFSGLLSFRLCSAIFLAQNKTNAHAFVEMIYHSGNIIYFIIIYIFGFLTLANIFLGYFISGLLVLIYSLFFINYRIFSPLQFSKENFQTIVTFIWWVTLGHISSYLINWGDNIILKQFVSLADIGVYNLAYQIFKGGIMTAFIISTYFLPFVSQNIDNKKEIKNYLENKKRKMMKFIFIGFILAEIMIGPVFRMFFDIEYYGGINVIRILLLSNLIMFNVIFYLPILNAAKQYHLDNIILIFQLAANLVLDIIFIKKFGYIGAAIGTTLSYILYGIMIEVVLRKKIWKRFT